MLQPYMMLTKLSGRLAAGRQGIFLPSLQTSMILPSLASSNSSGSREMLWVPKRGASGCLLWIRSRSISCWGMQPQMPMRSPGFSSFSCRSCITCRRSSAQGFRTEQVLKRMRSASRSFSVGAYPNESKCRQWFRCLWHSFGNRMCRSNTFSWFHLSLWL